MLRAVSVLLLMSVPLLGAADPPVEADESVESPPPEARPVPTVTEPGAPPEEQLEAPPNAERAAELPGYVAVENPAFPTPRREAPTSPSGPRRALFGRDQLAPYFAEPQLAAVKAAFDRGELTRARALLAFVRNDSLPVRYLRAQVALQSGELATAARELTTLAAAYRPLADRCLFGAASAREKLGELTAAAQLLEQVPADSRLWAEARLALSRVKLRLKDRAGAQAALEALTALGSPAGRGVIPEALWMLADLFPAKSPEQLQVLRRIWAQYPASSMAARAEKRLGGPPTDLETRVQRAEALVEAHQNRAAQRVMEPLVAKLALPDPIACRGHFAFGKALRKERSHTRAIQVLAPVAEKCRVEDLLPRVLYVLGSSQSIVAQRDGIGTYARLAREYPAHPFADDALFYAADLEVKTGQLDAALTRLGELAARYPSGDFAAEALFKSFWIHRARGQLGAAVDVLERIETLFAEADEPYEVERARYWKARTLSVLGREAEGRRLFEQLATQHPSAYYGIRAGEIIGEPKAPPAGTRSVEVSLDPGPLADDIHFAAGVELLRLGMPDAASGELMAAVRESLGLEALQLLAQLLSAAGDTRSAHAVARTALRKRLVGPLTPERRMVWEIAYPRAFRELIEKHCAAVGLDPDLLQALMREESALDPRALSWAGALGLTQLMPSTAKQVAQRLKIPHFTTARLMDPDTNIRLGATYLAGLMDRFGGNVSLALAGYNAGASQVDRWLAGKAPDPLDAWVEEIPLSETRGYVKRVLRSYRTYRLLYPPPASGGPMSSSAAAATVTELH